MSEAMFNLILVAMLAGVLVALWFGLGWIDQPEPSDESTEHGDGEP
jgi:hypothetical protein